MGKEGGGGKERVKEGFGNANILALFSFFVRTVVIAAVPLLLLLLLLLILLPLLVLQNTFFCYLFDLRLTWF